MTFHVDLILACTTCLVPIRCFISSSFVLVTPNRGRVSKGPVYIYIYIYVRTYVCGTNILGRTACEHATLRCWSNSIQFHRFSPSLSLLPSFVHRTFFLSFFFFHPVSISDLHDPLTPWRTIDPRLTLLGVVSLSTRPLSSRSLRYSPFSPPLLLCSLMRGRDHLEYNFASFRIIIDFVSRSSFPFFSHRIFFNSSSLLLSNNHRLI